MMELLDNHSSIYSSLKEDTVLANFNKTINLPFFKNNFLCFYVLFCSLNSL